jgi:hypothetical protein
MDAEKPKNGKSEATITLPELKGGEVLVDGRGHEWRVHLVRHPRRDTGYDEPIYRLERTVLCNGEWTLDELGRAGLQLKG